MEGVGHRCMSRIHDYCRFDYTMKSNKSSAVVETGRFFFCVQDLSNGFDVCASMGTWVTHILATKRLLCHGVKPELLVV